jgi:hypothetical protein
MEEQNRVTCDHARTSSEFRVVIRIIPLHATSTSMSDIPFFPTSELEGCSFSFTANPNPSHGKSRDPTNSEMIENQSFSRSLELRRGELGLIYLARAYLPEFHFELPGNAIIGFLTA